MASTQQKIRTGSLTPVLKASSSVAALAIAMSVAGLANAQTVITSNPAVLDNAAVIDAGAGSQAPAIVVIGEADGTALDIQNSGTLQGRGQAGAGSPDAGDGIRFERERVNGALDATTSGLFTGNINNTGTIDSESAQGTAAGIRFVNGVSFSGTIDNSGTISGVQNGLYFGNATPAGGGDFTGAVVNNSGTISSDSRALNIDGTGLVVNNTGTILGTGDQRNGTVYADATANNFVINNLVGGVIDAGTGNAGSGISLQLGAVDGDTRTISVSNDGSVFGRGDALASGQTAGLRLFSSVNNVTVNGDISNTGSISSETAPAILIENVNYTGTITNTGDLSGSTIFDASAALGAVNFVQAGGSLNGDFVGSAFADTLSLAGGTVNGSILGNVATSVEEGALVTFTGQQTLEGDLTANGTLNFVLGTDSLAVDGNTTFGAASIVNIDTDDDITNIALGTPILVISETGTFTDNGVTVNVNDDDFLIDYSVILGSVAVTANAADLSGVSADTNVSAFGGALTTAFAANALDGDIANALNDLSDAAGFETASLSLLPSINEGVTREIFESHSLADQFVTRRLRSDAPRGLWIEGFGRVADRDADSTSVSGYDADAFGVALGVDGNVNQNVTIGASFNFANISIDSDGPSNEETELDSFQISTYASYEGEASFVTGQVGYVFGDGESVRTGLSGPIGSDFDVSGVTAQLTAGYSLPSSGAWSLTPNAGLRFASLSQSDFTENGGLNLAVSSDDVQYLDARIGADLEGNYGGFNPFVRVGYVYDLIGDERVFNADFAGANAPFTLTTSEPAQSRFDVNTGFSINTGNSLSINVEYDGEFASGYQSHGGFLRARVAF